MPLGAITGIADGLGSVVMNAVSGIQRRRERNQAHRHHEDAMAVAKRNYEFSREQHAYQQYSNVRQHQREDTQIQRTMADARAAGIHPVAALGMGGQAGVPSNAVNAPSGVGASGSIAAGAKGDMGMLDAYLDIQRFRDDLRNSSAQRDLIKAKAERERAETTYTETRERDLREIIDPIRRGNIQAATQNAVSAAGLSDSQTRRVAYEISESITRANLNEQNQINLVQALRESGARIESMHFQDRYAFERALNAEYERLLAQARAMGINETGSIANWRRVIADFWLTRFNEHPVQRGNTSNNNAPRRRR